MDNQLVGTFPSEPIVASWAYPLQDGNWMAVWRGERCHRSFPSLDAVMAYIELCDEQGALV